MSTSERIKKALNRLRQRYGVTAGFTSEPKDKAVRHGLKVSFNSASLKMLNEDSNTLEVFAYMPMTNRESFWPTPARNRRSFAHYFKT